MSSNLLWTYDWEWMRITSTTKDEETQQEAHDLSGTVNGCREEVTILSEDDWLVDSQVDLHDWERRGGRGRVRWHRC